MPNIREFNGTDASFRPTDTGADAIAASGRRVGALTAEAADRRAKGISDIAGAFTEVGQTVLKDAERYISHKEEMKVSADYAGLQNNALKGWDAALKGGDPNDPDLEKNYREQVLQPMLDSFTGRYTTQRGQERAAQLAGSLTDTLNTRIRSDRNTLAAEQGVLDITATHNFHADTLYHAPAMLDQVQAQTDALIATAKQAPGLDAIGVKKIENMRIKMREDNVVAAVHGIAEKDPAAARAALDSGIGGVDLSAAQRANLINYTTAQENFTKERDRAAQAEKDRNERKAEDIDANRLMGNAVQPDGSVVTGAAYFNGIKSFIEKHPNASPGLVTEMYRFGKQAVEDDLSGKFVKSDPDTLQGFRDRMTSENPKDVPQLSELTKAANDHKLSKLDAIELHQQSQEILNDKVMKAAVKRVTEMAKGLYPKIDPSAQMGMIRVPEQAERLSRFKDAVYQMALEKYRTGTIEEMTKPDFLENLAKQGKYIMSPNEAMQQRLNNMRGNVAAPGAILTTPAVTAVVKSGIFDKGASIPGGQNGPLPPIDDAVKDILGSK